MSAHKKKLNCEKLHSDTIAELNAWKAKNAYWWCEDLRSAKQRMEERKQKQARIDPEDEHCYKELRRRIDLLLSDPSRDILLEERYEKAFPSTEEKKGSSAAEEATLRLVVQLWHH